MSAIRIVARATAPAERARHRLLVGAFAAAGALVIVAAQLVRLPDVDLTGFAPFVAQPGLRVGVVVAITLLVLPVALFAVQAAHLGSVVRERRLTALRLAGATPQQLRGIAARQTGRAGLVGGVLAGPGYLALWVFLGVLPGEARLLPQPQVLDLVVWAVVIVLGGLGGVLTGIARPRRVRSGRRPMWVLVALLGVGWAVTVPSVVTVIGAASMVGAAVVLFRTPLAVRTTRRMVRRGRPVDVLAGARLDADPGPPGRAAAVLGLCGLAFGVQGGFAAATVDRDDAAFYLAGVGLAGAVTVVAVLVAVFALVVAAADQIVGDRRSVAALHALGADPALHRRVLLRRLTVVSMPVACGAAFVGAAAYGVAAVAVEGVTPGIVIALLVPVPLTALAVLGMARLAVLAVDGLLRAAADPAQLRTA